MADHYVTTIANALAELHSELSTQGFKDLYSDNMEIWEGFEWTWQDFFINVAWMGLHETEEFASQIEDDASRHSEYRFYNQESEGDVKCD